jgi:AraC-like DNA-binding protein
MWRAAGEDRVLLMAGQTARYAIEPRGEFVFGIVTGQPMRARRGHEHALQVAQRIRVARRRLEAGESIADTAAATGFADQSHLHRHFQRSLV